MDAVTELALTKKYESSGAKTSTLTIEAPQQRPKVVEGFGFRYSDTESADEESDHPNHVIESLVQRKRRKLSL